jgi:hypothetical protein
MGRFFVKVVAALLSAGVLLGCQGEGVSPTAPESPDAAQLMVTLGEESPSGSGTQWVTLWGAVVDESGECLDATVQVLLGPGAGRSVKQHRFCAWWDDGDIGGFQFPRMVIGQTVVLRASAPGYADQVMTVNVSRDTVIIRLVPFDRSEGTPHRLMRRVVPE